MGQRDGGGARDGARDGACDGARFGARQVWWRIERAEREEHADRLGHERRLEARELHEEPVNVPGLGVNVPGLGRRAREGDLGGDEAHLAQREHAARRLSRAVTTGFVTTGSTVIAAAAVDAHPAVGAGLVESFESF